jgi:hypothetical protein
MRPGATLKDSPVSSLLFKRLSILLVASAAILTAGNPWSKDSSQWSAEDVQRILTDSPWSRVAGGTLDNTADDTEKGVELPPGNEHGDRNGATDGRWDGGVSRNTGGVLPTLPVSVRWDSAALMVTALEKSPGATTLTEEQAKQYYVLTVVGLVAGRNPKRAARPDSAPPVDPEQVLAGIKSQSHLYFGSQPGIRPEDVKLDITTGTLRFFFPRTSPAALDDKEVIFATHYGRIKVVQRFRLKDMVYKGVLEL